MHMKRVLDQSEYFLIKSALIESRNLFVSKCQVRRQKFKKKVFSIALNCYVVLHCTVSTRPKFDSLHMVLFVLQMNDSTRLVL